MTKLATNKEIMQIAQLLRVAEWRMAYCETIAMYPTRFGKKDFDPTSTIDNFYKNICVMSFNDAILILGSLLDERGKTISFWHFDDFVKDKKNEVKLRSLKELFKLYRLQDIRNQIIAHQDKNNPINTYPDTRIKGYINHHYVARAQEILFGLIVIFLSCMKKGASPYDPEYFSNAIAKEQINTVLEYAKPTLTNDCVG
jgi:hypothetical protein